MHPVLCFALVFSAAAAAEQRVPSTTVSVGLFKNGVGVVTCEVAVPGPGTYLVADAPTPVHGTFWVTSGDDVTVRVGLREVTEPATADRLVPHRDLAGKRVTLRLGGDRPEDLTGMLRRSAAPTPTWSRGYEVPPGWGYWGYWGYGGRGDGSLPTAPAASFLLLDTDAGPRFVRETAVEQIQVHGAVDTIAVQKPVLIFEIVGESKLVRYSFLTKGLSWAPGYRLDLTGADLVLRQQAVIRNEYADLAEVELLAISGFPHLPFSHVDSPLAAGTSWAGFFQQLNQRVEGPHAAMGNRAMTQQVMMNNGSVNDGSLAGPPIPDGEQGVDLHFQSLGRRSLPAGESLACLVAMATGTAESLVEWNIPDLRQPNGRIIDDWQRQQNPADFIAEAWDAISFANPFAFPMTTGTMTIYRDDRLAGQTLSGFVNPKGTTAVRVTKALSVGVRQSESEIANSRRSSVRVNGHDHTQVGLEGKLSIRNHRATPTRILVCRRLTGTVDATSEPPVEDRLLDEGAEHVNQRHELRWSFTLAPGEAKEITYRYTVLEW
jgi:hypothetical protein